ncbi:hypothetical protein D920_00713 [Enterococcus faecalis 13-SD-W-01]|nr:hypothetical protein D920_00713 [Enterococcus faecalis 13-SD-W-01]
MRLLRGSRLSECFFGINSKICKTWKAVSQIFSLMLKSKRFVHDLYLNGVQTIASTELSPTN